MVTLFKDSICENKFSRLDGMMSGGPPTSNQTTTIYSPVTVHKFKGFLQIVCSRTPAEKDVEDGRVRLGAVEEWRYCQQEVWPSPLGSADHGPKTTSISGFGEEKLAQMFF